MILEPIPFMCTSKALSLMSFEGFLVVKRWRGVFYRYHTQWSGCERVGLKACRCTTLPSLNWNGKVRCCIKQKLLKHLQALLFPPLLVYLEDTVTFFMSHQRNMELSELRNHDSKLMDCVSWPKPPEWKLGEGKLDIHEFTVRVVAK